MEANSCAKSSAVGNSWIPLSRYRYAERKRNICSGQSLPNSLVQLFIATGNSSEDIIPLCVALSRIPFHSVAFTHTLI